MQYGVIERSYKNSKERYLWQLFTEGIAMVFEQMLIDNPSFFHQDHDGWLLWCDQHFEQIKHDFNRDIEIMNDRSQRYFGDWVHYNGYPDIGYYLGAKFVQYILNQHDLDEIIAFDIPQVESFYKEFLLI
jgi:hypothetical protein